MYFRTPWVLHRVPIATVLTKVPTNACVQIRLGSTVKRRKRGTLSLLGWKNQWVGSRGHLSPTRGTGLWHSPWWQESPGWGNLPPLTSPLPFSNDKADVFHKSRTRQCWVRRAREVKEGRRDRPDRDLVPGVKKLMGQNCLRETTLVCLQLPSCKNL